MRCCRLETDCVPSDGLDSDSVFESIMDRLIEINDLFYVLLYDASSLCVRRGIENAAMILAPKWSPGRLFFTFK